MNTETACLTNDDLNCKAIVDLIDNTECSFFYQPDEQLGYVTFYTANECYEFIERICNIKDSIIYLYDCYNCNN